MATLFERFSSKENLKLAFKYVQRELTHATLSVNPINHPALTAINALGEHFFVALERYIRDGGYAPEKGFFVYIPKDNLGLRPVCVLSMIDRIVYQAIFNQNILGYKIDGQLSDKSCFAYRVNDDEKDDFFVHYSRGWDAYLEAQEKSFRKGFTWKTEIDVQQYYEHIPIKRLIENLKTDFGVRDEQMLELLKNQLSTWAEYPDLPKGIPQGQSASSVLGNAYLTPLDRFVEENLAGKNLRYFRYVDDIALMGKSKADLLKATEKIAHFLRSYNLNLNEKTRICELSDIETISALRLLPEYAEMMPEMPANEVSVLKEKVPSIIKAILDGEDISKRQLRDIKYYLRVGTEYEISFLLDIISIIPLKPSLVVLIIQYITEARRFLFIDTDNGFEINILDTALWEAYNHDEISKWSKFWILKLLVSSERVSITALDKEMKRFLSSREATIFKIVSFYYETIQGRAIPIETVNRAAQESESNIEKSIYSFFLSNAFDKTRISTARNHIEKLLYAPSHEMNLIGCYILQSKQEIKIDDYGDGFSSYIFEKRHHKKKNNVSKQQPEPAYFMVPRYALTPIQSPASVLGVARPQRTKATVSLTFPEPIIWEKVSLKMKEGMRELEIFYDGKHIETADFVQLGFFTGKKNSKPNRSWHFLCAIAALSVLDITQATPDKLRKMVAMDSKTTVSTNNVHHIKKSATNQLRILFRTDENPFHEDIAYYSPRFKILPEPVLRREELWRQGGRLNENRALIDDEEVF